MNILFSISQHVFFCIKNIKAIKQVTSVDLLMLIVLRYNKYFDTDK